MVSAYGDESRLAGFPMEGRSYRLEKTAALARSGKDRGEEMAEKPGALLESWLARQLPAESLQWLEAQFAKLRAEPSERNLHIALGMIPRRLGKDDLELSDDDLAAAEAARPGWNPRGWAIDEAARVLLLLITAGNGEGFVNRFQQLCRTADLAEAIALYRGLPLYLDPAALEAQAAEGVRSNMRAIFEAVAHRNPYPREQFDENRWNQMVLKALFVGSRLDPIQGLDQRANPALAAIMVDYAHERWAAGRKVSPELWRCVGPFALASVLPNLERVLRDGDETERKAGALALAASPAPGANTLLATAADLAAAIEAGDLNWDRLAKEIPA